jgi:3-hydroxyisobutyrate dehydrogenase-like beta-hydroxyacid dehydrogenase
VTGRRLLLKLAINISLAVQTLAFSEGLLLAERGGVDPELAAEVMLTNACELGNAHRDLAALHETLARTAPAPH